MMWNRKPASKTNDTDFKRLIKIAFFILFLSGKHVVIAQSSPLSEVKGKSSIQLQWGAHFLNMQDQLLTPMVQQDVSFTNIGLHYLHRGNKARNRVSISVDKYHSQSHNPYTYISDGKKENTFISVSTIVNARYSHLRSFSGSPWFAGIMFDNQIRAGEQAYGWTTTFHYLGTFSLSPTLLFEQNLTQKWKLSLQTWLPFISWVTRSPYALNDDQYMRDNANHIGLKTFFNYVANGNLQSINRFQKINFHSTISYQISRKIGVLISYQLEALRYTKPLTLLSYQHYLDTGIQLSF